MPDHNNIRTRLAELVRTEGLPGAANRLHMRADTLARIVAGARVQEGTMLLAAHRLGLLGTPQGAAIASTPPVLA